jgi:hypothetical protein
MFSTRKSVLQYKSQNSQCEQNTLLHDLILENNVARAKAVIDEDQHAADGLTIINQKALGNTPLLLALKTGAIEIALAILEHNKINVSDVDSRGLTALHWACMLRQDAVIQQLLEKGADPLHQTRGWNHHFAVYDSISPITPAALYQANAPTEIFSQYAMACYKAIVHDSRDAHLYEEKYPNYYHCFYHLDRHSNRVLFIPPFKDHEQLYIPGAAAYTDIIFHLREICLNLRWTFPTTEFVTHEKTHRTLTTFKHNFIEGLFAFCKFRNEIPVNQALLSKLTNTHDVTEQLSHLSLNDAGAIAAALPHAAASPHEANSNKPTRV